MTVAMHPASHRRSLSPPAPRRNTNAIFARCPQSLPDRRERDTPAQFRDRKRPTSPVPPPRLSVADYRRVAREPFATRKSP
jgi:hypothetical protein